ncbi:MAG: DNA primase [Bacteroidaceae bacterium]|nr:DNA primase [Bacteroidaceae bacterium]
MIDQPTVERIMDAANIVEVVSEFVTLKKRGVNFVGLCPFHDEKTPSFSVSPARGICKCFSCGKGGNAVHFIMEHEQMTYYEALKFLAKKYNIEVQERVLTDKEKEAQSARESLFIVNEFAATYFQNILHNHIDGQSIGMSYFRNRGFRDDIIQKFQLGFSTNQREALYLEAMKRGYKKEYLEETGLCYTTDNGKMRDRFWGRAIFPIHTLSGKVIAFGGRVLKADAKTAKYVNSPESQIYHKSKELYGIYFAKQSIIKKNLCFLVEGYTDVISMHQAGVTNVVASSGTALTTGQIKMIHRLTDNITVLYDGDAAGIKASIRGIDMLLEEGMNIKVLLLPDGEDPDSFAKSRRADDFQAYIDKHQVDFIQFKTDLLLKEAGNDPIKRSELITDIVKSIAVIPRAIVRDVYINECSRRLKINNQLLLNEVIKIKRNAQERDYAKKKPTRETPIQAPTFSSANEKANQAIYKREETITRILVRYGDTELICVENEQGEEEVLSVAQFIINDLRTDDLHFTQPVFKEILELTEEHLAHPQSKLERVLTLHPQKEIRDTAMEMLNDRYELSRIYTKDDSDNSNKLYDIVLRVLADYKSTIISNEIKELTQSLKDPNIAGNDALCKKTLERYQELKQILDTISKQQGDRSIIPL